MERCETCKFWSEDRGGLGLCRRITPFISNAEDRETVAVTEYIDTEDEATNLWTGPKFGCVLWEAQAHGPGGLGHDAGDEHR